MSDKLPKDALVLIASGTQAKMYRNRGEDELELHSVGTLTPLNKIGEGPSGSRPPELSLEKIDKATFSKQVAETLYQKAHAGEFKHLALVADSETLGELRPLLHQEVTSKLVLELDRTLINTPVERIEAIIGRERCSGLNCHRPLKKAVSAQRPSSRASRQI